MRLKRVQIHRFGPLSGVDLRCQPGLTVVYGSNESGKTLTVDALVHLLAPEAARKWSEIGRVSEKPDGYVVLEWAGREVRLDERLGLAGLEGSALKPEDVRNLLVIRDSDLKIAEETSYYGTLTERLAGVRLQELLKIKELLREEGRLTPGLQLANDKGSHYPRSTRDDALQLAGEMRTYIQEADGAGLDAFEGQALDVAFELAQLGRREEALERARRVHEHGLLSARLEQARQALASFDELNAFGPEGLEELRELETGIASTQRELGELETEGAKTRESIGRLEEEVRALQAEIEPLRVKASRLQDVELGLREARSKREGQAALRREVDLARRLVLMAVAGAVLSLLWAGAASRGALLGVGAVLLLTAALAAVWYLLRNRQLRGAEASGQAAIQAAQDQGLVVSALDEMGPAVHAFRIEFEQRAERLSRTEAARNARREREAELASLVSERRQRLDKLQKELRQRLTEREVDSVDGYAAQLAKREQTRSSLRAAASVLLHRFQNGSEEPTGETLEMWQMQLDQLVEDIQGAEAQAYDEEEHQRVQRRMEEIESRREELEAELGRHREKLRGFSDRAQRLDFTPFVNQPVDTSTHSTRQLERLAERLEDSAEGIDRDAELARRTIEIFEAIRQKEEAKVSHLFGEGDRASQLFSTLTGGRYRGLEYDPATRRIAALRDGAPPLDAEVLSHGTFDQLYLAVRVALAEQLLGDEPGFFIMDDAFLTADKARLRQGFQALQSLAQAGWSILYFTAKSEVGEDLAAELGLPVLDQKELP